MLDINIVTVSLPSIARDLHSGFTDVEWVVSAYILPFAASLMPAGALADHCDTCESSELAPHSVDRKACKLMKIVLRAHQTTGETASATRR